jgi:signal transduction histidine kinase
MELINNFANLSKTLSEKFSLKKSEVSLYLLVLIQHTFRLAEARYEEVLSTDDGSYLIGDEVLDRHIFRSIKNSGFINLKSYSESEVRSFTEYLIAEYLKSANISLPSSNFLSLIADLATESALELDILNSGESLYNTELSIYLADVGAGDIIIKLLGNLENKGVFAVNCGVVGEEPDKFLTFLTELNCFAHSIDAHLLIHDGNPLEKPFQNFGIGLEEAPQIAVSIPHFTNIPQKDLQNLYEFLGSTEQIYFSELAYIELMLKRVSERGKVIAIVRNEFLFSKKSKIFREKYLKNNWIEKIIALPKDFVGYSTDVSVIVFNKTKIEKGFVVFDGSEDRFEKTKVSIEEIFSNDVDLRVVRYAAKESNELESILSNYPQDEIKKIKDLIDCSISGFNYSPNNRIVENSSETLPYVRIKDLSNNDKDFTLDISKVERKISPEKVTHKRTIINFSAVLVSKIAPNLKPTLFNSINQPIVIGSDVVALKVREDVNVEYFLTQLYSQLVKIQVEMMSSGSAINRISIQDFLNIQIILPPLEDQQRQILEMRGLIAEKFSVEEKIVEAQFEVVASINHSLKNKLAVIINDYDTLIRFLRRKERKSETIIFSDAISANAVGDDIDTIEIITNRLKTNLSDASKVFNNALKIQRQNLKKDIVELVKFFKEEVTPLYAGKNFSIEVNVKPNLKLNVWLDKDAFKDVIENLIENAKSHGFIDDEKNYRIVFDLSKLKDEDDFDGNTSTKYARIVYKNDGKPFPKNFSFEDYKQFSNKSGKTQGTGIGGYVINKIIDLHDGRFNFISPSDDFTVEFEILLPLEN